MNMCDYYVHEVLSEPYHCVFKDSEKTFEWWNVDISYFYDNDELKQVSLDFKTKEEADEVKKGYHFLR